MIHYKGQAPATKPIDFDNLFVGDTFRDTRNGRALIVAQVGPGLICLITLDRGANRINNPIPCSHGFFDRPLRAAEQYSMEDVFGDSVEYYEPCDFKITPIGHSPTDR